MDTASVHQCAISKENILCTCYAELLIHEKNCCGLLAVCSAQVANSEQYVNTSDSTLLPTPSTANSNNGEHSTHQASSTSSKRKSNNNELFIMYESTRVQQQQDNNQGWDTGDVIGIFIDLRLHRESVSFFKNGKLAQVDALVGAKMTAPLKIIVDFDGGQVSAREPQQVPDHVRYLLNGF